MINIKYKKIFIMTLPRSGSTLLGLILSGHNKILHIGESMYWELLNPKDTVCSCGKRNCNFLNKIYNLVHKEHIARPLLKVWQIIDKKYWPNKKINHDSIIPSQKTKISVDALNYWLKQCKSSLEKIINTHKKISSKKIFIDNTKLFNIGEQLSQDKNWGIVVLLRNPIEIMGAYKNAGIRKKDLRSTESVLPFYYNFLQSVKRIENKINVIIIRYEDLCNNTEKVIKTICEFIGTNYQKNMINFIHYPINKRDHILKGNRLLYNNKKIFIKRDNSWKNNLSLKEIKNLQSNKKLIKLYNYFNHKYECHN